MRRLACKHCHHQTTHILRQESFGALHWTDGIEFVHKRSSDWTVVNNPAKSYWKFWIDGRVEKRTRKLLFHRWWLSESPIAVLDHLSTRLDVFPFDAHDDEVFSLTLRTRTVVDHHFHRRCRGWKNRDRLLEAIVSYDH